MMNSVVLDVGIGLGFVYLMLALICTAAHEWIAGVRGLRAKTLETGLQALLGSDDAAQHIFDHPLINSLSPKGGKPSYLPARMFALALVDTVCTGAQVRSSVEDFRGAVGKLPEATAARVRSLLRSPELSMAEIQKEVEDWFDNAMDRVSGWYKRDSQVRLLVLAAVVTILANADSLDIARRLWQAPTLRAGVIEAVRARVDKTAPTPAADDSVRLSDEERSRLGELTSWSTDFRALRMMTKGLRPGSDFPSDAERKAYDDTFPGWGLVTSPLPTLTWLLVWVFPKHLLGWFVTATAVSLGAPFWFDTLKSFVNLRAAGQPPTKQAQIR